MRGSRDGTRRRARRPDSGFPICPNKALHALCGEAEVELAGGERDDQGYGLRGEAGGVTASMTAASCAGNTRRRSWTPSSAASAMACEAASVAVASPASCAGNKRRRTGTPSSADRAAAAAAGVRGVGMCADASCACVRDKRTLGPCSYCWTWARSGILSLGCCTESLGHKAFFLFRVIRVVRVPGVQTRISRINFGFWTCHPKRCSNFLVSGSGFWVWASGSEKCAQGDQVWSSLREVVRAHKRYTRPARKEEKEGEVILSRFGGS